MIIIIIIVIINYIKVHFSFFTRCIGNKTLNRTSWYQAMSRDTITDSLGLVGTRSRISWSYTPRGTVFWS